jgi:lysophospholipase L1-like esterase
MLNQILSLSILALLLTLPGAAVAQDRPVEDASRHKLQTKANPSLPTLYLVGDSTMKVGTPSQRGWGEEMAPYFDLRKINVVNQAIGGRSSRTFQTEGRWDAVVAMLQKGDYVIIQFGHNDGGAINDNFRARASIKGTGEETQEIDNMLTKKHEVVHTYGWYLRKYANDVRAKGATPIILSLVPRNTFKDGKVARSSESYGKWAREAAEATKTAFIDHNEITAQAMEKIGPEKAAPLFADGRLHASPAGAQFNARCAVAGLKGLPGKPFQPYFSSAAADIVPFPAAAVR